MALSDEQWQKIADKTGCFITGGLKEAIEAEVRKQEREACALLAEQAHPHDWPFIGAAIRGRARLEDAK